jgi:DNA-binding response OmpR family regulator
VVSRTVDTHIAELRRKLEADPSRPRHILTVRKAGYRLAR